MTLSEQKLFDIIDKHFKGKLLMNIEQHVTSLDLSIKLKKLGIKKQDSFVLLGK